MVQWLDHSVDPDFFFDSTWILCIVNIIRNPRWLDLSVHPLDCIFVLLLHLCKYLVKCIFICAIPWSQMAYYHHKRPSSKLHNFRLDNQLVPHSSTMVVWHRELWSLWRSHIARPVHISQLCFPHRRANLHFRRLDVRCSIWLLHFCELFDICGDRRNSVWFCKLGWSKFILADCLGRRVR